MGRLDEIMPLVVALAFCAGFGVGWGCRGHIALTAGVLSPARLLGRIHRACTKAAACFRAVFSRLKRLVLLAGCKRYIVYISGLVSGLFSKSIPEQTIFNVSNLSCDSGLPIPPITDESVRAAEGNARLDLGALNSRVGVTLAQSGGKPTDLFVVEVCGTVPAPRDASSAIVRISIHDETDGSQCTKSVFKRSPDFQIGSSTFCFEAELGAIASERNVLRDWTVVATVRCDRLWFARKGRRMLLFEVCVPSGVADPAGGEGLSRSRCMCEYENPNQGYEDFEEDCQRARSLGVGLAFAVGAADGRLFGCEIDMIKSWARRHLGALQQGRRLTRELERQLNRTTAFFRRGNRVSVPDVCWEIASLAPAGERCDILELCLSVAGAKCVVLAEELTLLRDIGRWLEIDCERFEEMLESILPVGVHEKKSVESVLGITGEGDAEEIRQQLNREYGKWNARVTSPDPEVRSQADEMLQLIAEAYTRYVGLVKAT